jgi:predicted amidophosphoribosyltransferase
MIIKSKSNSYFKCSCKIRVGRCKNLEHPRIFTEYLANSHQKYIERWALSKYTIWPNETSNLNKEEGRTKIGQLINDYKYKKYADGEPVRKLNNMELNQIKDRSFNEIYKHIKYFLDNYFPENIREFNAIIPIPPTGPSLRTIPFDICDKLQGDGLINYKNFINVVEEVKFDEKNMKNIKDFDKKENILEDKFILGDAKNIENSTGILVIDDVYKTGATARRVLDIINSVAPEVPKYFLSVSFTVLNEVIPGGKV